MHFNIVITATSINTDKVAAAILSFLLDYPNIRFKIMYDLII